ncbi:hypothetical protein AEAC466_04350 [Asticcacaulis sp. AC466]|uniref:hypothetical protein n=1 Tax=Asticcacaulis sp. AC466 TaxID=1282362 RepID=UPI0003C3E40A|nr:hypothetical protein [Asticcacaulis sp. AC466]ESQ85402.1 hypothetical protein AEAC466_04350 [Asticcacaulis sp. AC466]
MKLASLNSQIRKTKHVKIWLRIPHVTTPLYVVVQKDSLLEALKAAHGGDNQVETDLSIRENGQLICDLPGFAPPDPEQQEQFVRQSTAVEKHLGEDQDEDEDDLLSDTFDPEEVMAGAEDMEEDLLA